MSDSQTQPVGEPPPAQRGLARLARFGAFELDVVTGELRRSGVPVKLQELPFRLLAFLLQRPGELVNREELQARLWPAEFVDFDHSLNTAVRKLRAALGDDADHPRYVETLARRGYRFIAPVTWSGAVTEPAEPQKQDRVSPPAAASPTRYAVVAILVLVIVGSLAAIPLWRREPAVRAMQASAIAVVPFVAENGAAEHVTDGLSEVIMNALSRVTDLRVIGRTTVFRYKGRPVDAREVGRDLNVGVIITGTVREQGGDQTIHVELLDTADGTRLWGQRYETRGSTLPAVHSHIAEDLTRRLRRGFDRSSRASTTNPRAYDLYLQGLQAWNRRTPEELQRAAVLLKQAVALDPEFADAHAALANTYGVMVGYDLISAEEGTPLVLSAVRAALAIDPANSDAYVSRATTKRNNLWDFEGAGADYRRALELNPSSVTGHQWYADYLRMMGKFEEAQAETTRAWELDPQSLPVATAYCLDARWRRQYDEALSRARNIPGWPRGSLCAVATLTSMGRYEDALNEMREGKKAAPRFLEALERGYREEGPRGYHLAMLKILRGRRDTATGHAVGVASVCAQLNDRDAAFAALEQAYAKRVSRLTDLHIEPAFDNLRDDPRFEDLLRRIGIPKEALAAADVIRHRAAKERTGQRLSSASAVTPR